MTVTLRDVSKRRELPTTNQGIDALLAAAQVEVALMSILSMARPDPLLLLRRINHHNLARGVRYRAIFPEAALRLPTLSTPLNRLSLARASIRAVTEVPMNALIIDSSIAVLPSDRSSAEVEVLELGNVVQTATALFERIWPTGLPLGATDQPGEAELTVRERYLLALLSACATDESVATRMGLGAHRAPDGGRHDGPARRPHPVPGRREGRGPRLVDEQRELKVSHNPKELT